MGGVFGTVLTSLATTLEGRTQAFGIVLGAGRPESLGGDCLLRQRESLMTRFLGAVATWTSSSSLLWTTGVCFALLGRSGLTSIDFLGVCFSVGVQLGLSSRGFAFGVEGGFGEGAGLSTGVSGGSDDVAAAAAAAVSVPTGSGSGSTSCCHRLILSRTLAGLFMPIALAKSLPFMLVCLSVAPSLPGVPCFVGTAGWSASLGIESRNHWHWWWASRRSGVARRCVLGLGDRMVVRRGSASCLLWRQDVQSRASPQQLNRRRCGAEQRPRRVYG